MTVITLGRRCDHCGQTFTNQPHRGLHGETLCQSCGWLAFNQLMAADLAD